MNFVLPTLRPAVRWAIPLLAISLYAHPLIGGAQELILLREFSRFRATTNSANRLVVWESEPIRARKDWNSLIVSWNAETPGGGALEIQASGILSGQSTTFYSLGVWSDSTNRIGRHSIGNQRDENGHVATDVLILDHPCRTVRLKVLLSPGDEGVLPQLRLLALSFSDTSESSQTRTPNRRAWGVNLGVPALSQHAYDGGKVWCSPTSVSMVMAYWAERLGRPELRVGVPEVAAGVYDSVYRGTGNWPFNTAFAGRSRVLEAYVTRLRDLRAIEDLVAQGIPVIISVSLTRLRERPPTPDDGHLAVVTGFDAAGDVWINDPDTTYPVRPERPVNRLHPRRAVDEAWATTHRTVYLLQPAQGRPVRNRRN